MSERNLYEVTGDIKDINTLLVSREEWNRRAQPAQADSIPVAAFDRLMALCESQAQRIIELEDKQPQAEAVQACGHPMSLLLRSAESNEPLYCEACDDKSGRHDAERRETELLDANRRLQEKIASSDALKLHAIEELCQLGYTVKDGELIPPDRLHKLVEAANHPLCGKQTEAVPSSALNPDESDSVTLWAEIWRLREAVKGPDGYATWQDAATAERIRRVRAESKQAAPVAQQYEAGDVASASAQGFRDGVASVAQQPQEIEVQCPVCSHKFYEWPEQAQAEAVPPTHVLVPVSLIKDSRWRIANLVGSDGAKGADRRVLDALDAAIDAAIAQQKGHNVNS